MERTLAVLGAALLLYHLAFDLHDVASPSMQPFLRSGDDPDWVLVERAWNGGRAPARRFSVVTFRDDEGNVLVKRVVGFPGETLLLRRSDRALLVDGVVTATPETVGHAREATRHGYLPCGNLRDDRPFLVPAGHVYVLGDDTLDSHDSRFTGPVPIARLRGRAVLRVYPFARFAVL